MIPENRFPDLQSEQNSEFNKIIAERDAFASELEKQAGNPAGGDEYIAHFNHGLILAMQELPELYAHFKTVQELRQNNGKGALTPGHLANLALRAFNYVQMWHPTYLDDHENNPFNYPAHKQLHSPQAWRDEFLSMIDHEDRLRMYIGTMTERDTQTNIPQRGIGPISVLHNLFGDEYAVDVADFGCSTHGILKKAQRQDPFDPLNVNETYDENIHERTITLGKAIGFDINEIDPRWITACRYPREVNNAEIWEARLRIDRDEKNPHVAFALADITDREAIFAHIEGASLDAAISNTTFYQLTPQQRTDAFGVMRQSVKDGGVVIIQDCFEVPEGTEENPIDAFDPTQWHFFGNFGMGQYRTHVFIDGNHYEVYTFGSGRCTEMYKGKDYDAFMQAIDQRNSQSR